LELLHEGVNLNIRKFSFCKRVVSIWNSLPDDVILFASVNGFKSKLDKFWSTQSVLYDYEAKLTGVQFL